jgi:hypothetical protein
MYIDHNVLLSSLTDQCFTITSWVVCFLTPPPFNTPLSLHLFWSAPLSPHPLASVFSKPTYFQVRLSPYLSNSAFPNPVSFQVRLWALVSPFEPYHVVPSKLFKLFPPGRSPITMRPFFHLGRSPIIMRPSFFWVGHPLQWDRSPHFISTRVGHSLQWDHSSLFPSG